MYNVKYSTYFCPNLIKSEKLTVSAKKVTKKEVLLNLNLAGPSGVKILGFLVTFLVTKTSR